MARPHNRSLYLNHAVGGGWRGSWASNNHKESALSGAFSPGAIIGLRSNVYYVSVCAIYLWLAKF